MSSPRPPPHTAEEDALFTRAYAASAPPESPALRRLFARARPFSLAAFERLMTDLHILPTPPPPRVRAGLRRLLAPAGDGVPASPPPFATFRKGFAYAAYNGLCAPDPEPADVAAAAARLREAVAEALRLAATAAVVTPRRAELLLSPSLEPQFFTPGTDPAALEDGGFPVAPAAWLHLPAARADMPGVSTPSEKWFTPRGWDEAPKSARSSGEEAISRSGVMSEAEAPSGESDGTGSGSDEWLSPRVLGEELDDAVEDCLEAGAVAEAFWTPRGEFTSSSAALDQTIVTSSAEAHERCPDAGRYSATVPKGTGADRHAFAEVRHIVGSLLDGSLPPKRMDKELDEVGKDSEDIGDRAQTATKQLFAVETTPSASPEDQEKAMTPSQREVWSKGSDKKLYESGADCEQVRDAAEPAAEPLGVFEKDQPACPEAPEIATNPSQRSVSRGGLNKNLGDSGGDGEEIGDPVEARAQDTVDVDRRASPKDRGNERNPSASLLSSGSVDDEHHDEDTDSVSTNLSAGSQSALHNLEYESDLVSQTDESRLPAAVLATISASIGDTAIKATSQFDISGWTTTSHKSAAVGIAPTLLGGWPCASAAMHAAAAPGDVLDESVELSAPPAAAASHNVQAALVSPGKLDGDVVSAPTGFVSTSKPAPNSEEGPLTPTPPAAPTPPMASDFESPELRHADLQGGKHGGNPSTGHESARKLSFSDNGSETDGFDKGSASGSSLSLTTRDSLGRAVEAYVAAASSRVPTRDAGEDSCSSSELSPSGFEMLRKVTVRSRRPSNFVITEAGDGVPSGSLVSSRKLSGRAGKGDVQVDGGVVSERRHQEVVGAIRESADVCRLLRDELAWRRRARGRCVLGGFVVVIVMIVGIFGAVWRVGGRDFVEVMV